MSGVLAGALLPRPFGRYQLLELLGEGGMASVYRAELTGPGGFTKKVAIKQIHPHLSRRSDYRASFLKEARLGGMLTHPNVVQILDFGACDGQLFLAMELVEGASLDRVLELHRSLAIPLPDWVFLTLGIQLCQGLAYAHRLSDEQGLALRLVHRDLKPSNVLLSRFGSVKLADFGIARADVNLASTLESGIIKGTTLYMSPEQALGLRELDGRSDLFAVGLILYELYTLRPFHRAVVAHLALRQAQLPEVEERLQELPPGPLTEGLRDILRRVLSVSPEDRYASASDLLDALLPLHQQLDVQSQEGVVAFPAWCARTLGLLTPLSREHTSAETAPYAEGALEAALASRASSLLEGLEVSQAEGASSAYRGDGVSSGASSLADETGSWMAAPQDRDRASSRPALASGRMGLDPGHVASQLPQGTWEAGLAGPRVRSALRAPPPEEGDGNSLGLSKELETGHEKGHQKGHEKRHGGLGLRVFLLSFGVGLLCVLLRLAGGFEPLDRLRQDSYALHVQPALSLSSVLVVDLEDGVEPWPWRRTTLAQLISRLLEEGEVERILLDVVLAERSSESEATRGEGNRRLAELASASGKVVFASGGLLEPGVGGFHVAPGERLASELTGVPTGFAALLAQGRGGGPVRRAILKATPASDADAAPLALSLATAGVAGGRPVQVDPELKRLNLGAGWIATDVGFGVELPPVMLEHLTVLRAGDLLQPATLPPGMREQVRGKYVLLGRFTDPFLDRVATPFGYRPGVAVQAFLTSALLEEKVRYRAGVESEVFLQLLVAGLLVFVWKGPGGRRTGRMLGLFGAACLLEILLLRLEGVWLCTPVVELGVLLGISGLHWLHALRTARVR